MFEVVLVYFRLLWGDNGRGVMKGRKGRGCWNTCADRVRHGEEELVIYMIYGTRLLYARVEWAPELD